MIDGQYRRPTGLLERIIGAQMVRDHEPENLWTVKQLAAQPTDQIVEIGCGADNDSAYRSNYCVVGIK
jgi:hypothetical protein